METYTIKDYINCKYNLEGSKYDDISNSFEHIENTILSKKENFNVKTNYHFNISEEDKNIFTQAIKKWTDIILLKTTNNENDLEINVYSETNNPNILAAARVDQVNEKRIPVKGSLFINPANWSIQKETLKEDGNNQAYYTILHELGHLFGIGTVWNHLIQDDFYVGKHAVKEYRTLLHQPYLKGIPVEDDGGMGTAGGHFEEGAEFLTSTNDRHKDGHFHTGLDRELMTGWAENDDGVEPLSRVSVGILQDLGYTVNYKKADPFAHESSGHLNPGEIITVNDISYKINSEMNFFYFHVNNITDYFTISSSRTSKICSLYVRFSNKDTFYPKKMEVKEEERSEIEIGKLSKTVHFLNNNKIEVKDIIIFFRN